MKNEYSIRDVLIDELKDILGAEKQILAALPNVIKAVQSDDLRDAFKEHLKETKGQVERLNKVFKLIGEPVTSTKCEAMEGLVKECDEAAEAYPKSAVRDAALISKCQRIEHYEIAAYGTVRTFAKELGYSEAVDLLDETLDEESNADKLLTKIAEGGLLTSGVNERANVAED